MTFLIVLGGYLLMMLVMFFAIYACLGKEDAEHIGENANDPFPVVLLSMIWPVTVILGLFFCVATIGDKVYRLRQKKDGAADGKEG